MNTEEGLARATRAVAANVDRVAGYWSRRWLALVKLDGARAGLRHVTRQEVTRTVDAIRCAYPDERPIAKWLRAKDVPRVVVFVDSLALCLIFDEVRGPVAHVAPQGIFRFSDE